MSTELVLMCYKRNFIIKKLFKYIYNKHKNAYNPCRVLQLQTREHCYKKLFTNTEINSRQRFKPNIVWILPYIYIIGFHQITYQIDQCV